MVATIATAEPKETWEEYREIFKKLGVKKVEWLDVRVREEGFKEEFVRILDAAAVVFFTGGDQLKITSQLGDSYVYRRIEEIYEQGGTIAGTSAGASVMSETMLISGDGDELHKVNAVLGMAPGLGLIRNAVVDQHFAQRGRLGRLLGAITQNPRTLGIGLDENTAILVHGDGAVRGDRRGGRLCARRQQGLLLESRGAGTGDGEDDGGLRRQAPRAERGEPVQSQGAPAGGAAQARGDGGEEERLKGTIVAMDAHRRLRRPVNPTEINSSRRE